MISSILKFDDNARTAPQNHDVGVIVDRISSIADSTDSSADFLTKVGAEGALFEENTRQKIEFIDTDRELSNTLRNRFRNPVIQQGSLELDQIQSASRIGLATVSQKERARLEEDRIKNLGELSEEDLMKVRLQAIDDGVEGASTKDIEEILEDYQGITDATSAGYIGGIGKVTAYGSPYWGHGLDIDLAKGDPVKSPFSGVVTFVGDNGGFGKQVKIKDSHGRETWLSHLDNINVKRGDNVSAGDLIGLGGNTGSVIPGPNGDGSHLDVTITNSSGNYLTPKQIERLLL